MNEVLQYLNNMITTVNPGFNVCIPERHPCQKGSNELSDDQWNYIDLINKLQRHTRCSPAYCFRVKNEQQYCRFNYLKENTFVRDDGHSQPELVTKKNDPFINLHSKLQLQG